MPALPCQLDPVWRWTAMLSGVMPIGANVYLITAHYQAYEERASTAILLSTALSVFTVSASALTVG